jgi:hypothetical protein
MAVSNVSTIGGDTWQLLNTATVSSTTSSVSISIAGATYKKIAVLVQGLTGTANYKPRIQFNNDTTSGNYGCGGITIDGANVVYGVDDSVWMGSIQNVSNWSSYMEFGNCDQASPKPMTYIGTPWSTSFQGAWFGTAAISSVQISPSTGSLTAGTIKIYGIPS